MSIHSAFGLPKQRERVKRHTLPDLPLKDEGKVFIKLSRPSACPDFSSMRYVSLLTLTALYFTLHSLLTLTTLHFTLLTLTTLY